MINMLALICLIPIVVEAITEILVDSKLLDKVRSEINNAAFPEEGPPNDDTWKQRGLAFLSSLFTCGYCMSVWVAAFVSLLVQVPITSSWIINYVLSAFLMHRLSNAYHVVYTIVKRGRVFSMDITLNAYLNKQDMPGEANGSSNIDGVVGPGSSA